MNPTIGLTPAPEAHRQRFLTRDEAERLIETISEEKNPAAADGIMLLLLTGARRSEITQAKWEYVDWKKRTLLVPVSKSGRPRRIALNSRAIALLRSLQPAVGGGYIFPSPVTGHGFASLFYPWDRIRRRARLLDVRLHDLRHSFASFLVNEGASCTWSRRCSGTLSRAQRSGMLTSRSRPCWTPPKLSPPPSTERRRPVRARRPALEGRAPELLFTRPGARRPTLCLRSRPSMAGPEGSRPDRKAATEQSLAAATQRPRALRSPHGRDERRANAMHAKGYAPGTANGVLVLLRYIFNLAHRWSIPGAGVNPTAGITPAPEAPRQRFLTRDEADRLLAAIGEERNRSAADAIMLLLLTGARRSEITQAKWGYVDWQKRTLLVPVSKSGRPRRIALSCEAITLLQSLPPAADTGYIFPSPVTGRGFGSVFYAWDRIRRRAGLLDVRLHDLRHSFASFLVNQGVSLYVVQALLGHSQ